VGEDLRRIERAGRGAFQYGERERRAPLMRSSHSSQRTDQSGFPLMVSAFEGNKAETKTMLPVIESFMAAHGLPVVADAGMVSEANQKQIEAAGLSFILGMKIPHVPYVVAQWRREHPGEQIPDGHIFTQLWPAGPNGGRRDQVIYYQYTADRAGAPCAASMSRSQGRAGRCREDAGEAEQVHPAVRRHQDREP
jgi:hypothetical protein